MSETVISPDAGTAEKRAPVSVAPYALARVTSLAYPAESRPSAEYRSMLRHIVALDTEIAVLAPTLCDALYASRGGHSTDFHHDVVLPLRRAVHNGREPGPGLLSRLGDLPSRLPELRAWLDARAERAQFVDRSSKAADEALAAERRSLAAMCREPALHLAAALTSEDLLRGIQRAGRPADADPVVDRRGRKAEPGVLRYALRASTKTSPLSWFAMVGWGRLDRATELAEHSPSQSVGAAVAAAEPVVVTTANRTLVETFLDTLLADPRRCRDLLYRLDREPRVTESRVTFLRTRQLSGGRFLATGEDEVEVARSGPLDVVIAHARNGVGLDKLVSILCSRSTQADGHAFTKASAFVQRLVEARLLVPCSPVDPQSPDPLRDLATWLRGTGDTAIAARAGTISAATAAFAATAPALRRSALRSLATQWADLFAAVGRPAPDAPVLTEDVVVSAPMPMGGLLTEQDRSALGEFAAFAELYDVGHVARDAVRDAFVARYGRGGVCPRPWEFAPQVKRAWQNVEAPMARPLTVDWQDEVFLDPAVVGAASERFTPRPVSYSFFVQRDEDSGLLCVNHIHGGWGRFTSRFLPMLAPEAAAAVAGQIREGLGHGARPVQIRPVGGFNANLHPRLVRDELGEERRWATLTEGDVELFHDPETDQVRVRRRGGDDRVSDDQGGDEQTGGEPLDILYAGFLAPVMLPDRLAPFVNDLPAGVVNLAPLLPRQAFDTPGGPMVRTPRLRHRHLVLRRQRWHLPAAALSALRSDLAAAGEAPGVAMARWRSILDLPEQVFIHPAPLPDTTRTPEGFLRQLRQPKPHFADLGNALHLRCLGKWLARHEDGVVFEEALPAAGGRARPHRAVELVVETYRSGLQSWT
jgi:hypothetical protein